MKKWAEQTDSNRERWISVLLLTALLLFFELMFWRYGPAVYNDSEQYLRMHIHREPLYPLFLQLMRWLSGEKYLICMGICQNLFMAVAIWLFAITICRRFRLSCLWGVLFALIQVFPHLMIRFFSALSIFITNSVMSEALTFPLFTIWSMHALLLLWTGRRRDVWGTLISSLLLSLTRSQMMVTLIVFMLIMVYRGLVDVKRKKCGYFVCIFLLVAASFGVRTLAVRSYNLVYNGHFINNTYGNVNLLTNMIYASDREMGEAITDEQTRAFFYEIFDKAWEMEGNYQFAQDTLMGRAAHVEKLHDPVKFECIENTFYQYYDQYVTTDYISQNLLADEQCVEMMKALFPQCFGEWLKTYCGIVCYGLIRNIAVVHPLINIAAFLIYVSAVWLTIWLYRRNRKSPAVPMMCLALLFIMGNTAAVSLTIMCLSRYMIYGFSLFYLSYLLVAAELLKTYRCAKLVKKSEE